MTQSIIPRAAAQGLKVLPDCRVLRINTQGRRAQSVTARVVSDNGKSRTIKISATRAIFLCAGAIHSPVILQRSGIFDRRIGQTLRMHPTVRVIAQFKDRVNAFNNRLPLNAVSQFMPEQRIGGSILTPAMFGLALNEDWHLRSHLLDDAERCASYYAMCRPEGVGTISSIPGLRDPIVRFGLTDGDWRKLTEGLMRLCRVLFAAGAEQIFPSIKGHSGWTSEAAATAELQDRLDPKQTHLMSIHLFSSAAIGEHNQCGVDSYGRVKSWDNIFVADASLIPEATGVNPQGTVMALAARAADAYLSTSDRQRANNAFAEAS